MTQTTTNIPATDIINPNCILLDTCSTIIYIKIETLFKTSTPVMKENKYGHILMGYTRIIVTPLP